MSELSKVEKLKRKLAEAQAEEKKQMMSLRQKTYEYLIRNYLDVNALLQVHGDHYLLYGNKETGKRVPINIIVEEILSKHYDVKFDENHQPVFSSESQAVS